MLHALVVVGIGGPASTAARLGARPLPGNVLRELARVVVQLGGEHGLHQHVPVGVESVLVGRDGNVLVDTAVSSFIRTDALHTLAFTFTFTHLNQARLIMLTSWRQGSRRLHGKVSVAAAHSC